jgi:predicted ATP-dependent serine protease
MKTAVSTAIPELDDVMFGGLVKGEVTIITGATMSGKSHFLINLCANLADQGKQIVYITLEETEEKVAASIRFIKLNTSAKQLAKLIYIKQIQISSSIDDIKEIVSAHEKAAKCTVDVIMIDGVDLLKSSVTTNRVPDYMKYEPTTELKNYAQAYSRICVGTTQSSSLSSAVLKNIKLADHVFGISPDWKLYYVYGAGKVGYVMDLAVPA